MSNLRVGYGEDAHKLVTNKPLIIGNVTISESVYGTLAHSDGDVLLHAITDALLSSVASQDIGYYFPPSNPKFKGMSSADILKDLLNIIKASHKVEILNVVAVVILDKPKLGKYRQEIAQRVAELLNLEANQIGVTFKTSEGFAPEYIQARATLLLSVVL